MARPNILYTAFVAQDFFTGPIAGMRGSLRKLAMGTDAVTGKLNSSFLGLTNTMMGAAAGAAAIIIPLGLATKAAIDFEKQMGNVATIVDTTTENMDDMGQNVLRIARQIPKPIHDLTEALYWIRSAGVDANSAMEVLHQSGKLAVTGLSSTTEAAKAITSAMQNFKKEGLTAAQTANSFFVAVQNGKTKMEDINQGFGENAPLVASAGVKLEEYLGILSALTQAGLSASEAQNGLRMSTIALIRPSNEMKEVFAKLKVATGEDLIQRMGGLNKALIAVKETAASMPGIEAGKLFNRTALTSYILQTGQVAEAVAANTKREFENVDDLITKFAGQVITADSQINLFKNRVAGLGVNVGSLLVPALEKTLGVLNPLIDGISYLIKNDKTLIEAVITTALVLKAAKVAAIGYNFVLGVMAVRVEETALKEKYFNWQLAATPGYAKGAAAGLAVMNTSAKALLLSLGRIAAVAVPIYILMKTLDEHDRKRAKMDVVLANLPAGMDPEKMKKAPLDYIMNAGFVDDSTKKYYDAYNKIGKEKYDDPMRIQDSIMDNMNNPHRLDTTLINNNKNKGLNAEGKPVGFNAPSVGSPFSEGNKMPSAGASDNTGPKSRGGEYTFTFVNETGFNMNVDKRGDAASPVKIKIKSTTSKNKDVA